LYGHQLYVVWGGIKQRCRNERHKDWPRYGGIGRVICDGWFSSFVSFVEDMGPRPPGMSVERIDNDGGYTCGHCAHCLENGWPANCRWATAAEQNMNTRRNKHRTPTDPDNRGYDRAHAHVRRQGKAKDQICPCGRSATDWAYRGGDPNERVCAKGLVYSDDVTYYVAMCRHAQADREHAGAEARQARAHLPRRS
jgi:hypothetical protein